MPNTNASNSRIELSASAFMHNVTTYKKIIGSAELGIVVKGNAYGHGLDEIVSLTKNHPDVAWYFTASLSEALYLRTQGVTEPILVMSIIDADPLLAFEQGISLIFHQQEQLADLERANNFGLKPKVHLKVDTGLSRFGFLPHECTDIVKQLVAMPHITLEGIFTHFAKAEIPDQLYSDLQMQKFSTLTNELSKIIQIPYQHSHATSATLFRGKEDTNLCRVGAGLYGLWPSYALQTFAAQRGITLKQILTWKTRIVHTRTVAAGTPIGYGCSFIAPRSMRIAFLPIGYADGYHRRLSNCGNVRIDNNLAPVVGRVGMNSITVDISNVPHAQTGTEVILTGPHPGITALDLAHAIGGFNPREITVPIICGTRVIVE